MKITRSLVIVAVVTAMMMTTCGYAKGGDVEQTASSGEVKIGSQVWMAANLNVDKFRNGDPIPHAKTNEEWGKAG
jgi:hypothetical protein